MTDRVPQTQQDLQRQLQEQIQFIKSSALAFDSGFDAEAKRLAVSLRVLLHDTSSSRSLLSLLNLKNIKFYDTAVDYDPRNLATTWGLVIIKMTVGPTPQKPKYIAPLDNPSKASIPLVDFEIWWNKIVFADNQRRKLKRKDLILSAANQDGGAHVDPALDRPYADLSRSNSLGWLTFAAGDIQPMDDPTRAAIRQIAHEVLKSLIPGYTKTLEN